MKGLVWSMLLMIAVGGCSGNTKVPLSTLHAPIGTAPAVTQQLEQGNQHFAAQNWIEAKTAYLSTIQAEPSLAEAHYNLALTLDRLGDKAEARKHYVKAANLAPGNKVIWNAPPLRKFDGDEVLEKKSFMDANPR